MHNFTNYNLITNIKNNKLRSQGTACLLRSHFLGRPAEETRALPILFNTPKKSLLK